MPCRLLFLLAGLFTTTLSAQNPGTAQVRGRVTARSETPISAAEITLLGTGRSVLTDSAGRFQLQDLAPGRHVIQVRRIGFQAQYLAAKLAAGEDKEVAIVLEPGSYELPEIKVTARATKPIEYAWTTKYDDFFRRQRVGLGRYITREDIEFRKPFRTANLLAGIAGIKVNFRHLGASGTHVQFARCNLPGDVVSVWIDGWKQRYPESTGPAAIGELIDRVLPSQIEMIEVYRGPAEMPAEFLDDSCAAIAIWTR